MEQELTHITDSLTIFKSMTALDSQMKDYIWNTGGEEHTWNIMIDTALMLGAILGLIMMAGMAYRMMVQEKGIDVLKLFKPLAIVIVLSNWYAITLGLNQLAESFEGIFRDGYEYNAREANALWRLRNARQDSLIYKLDSLQIYANAMRNMETAVEEEGEDEKYEIMGEARSRQTAVRDYLAKDAPELYYESEDREKTEMAMIYIDRMRQTRFWEDAIRWLGETIWEIAVFFIFLVKDLFLCVLVWFGPIIMAGTMMDTWKDEWASWIAKVVSVSLYGAAAYMVMAVCTRMMVFTYSNEVSYLGSVIGNPDRLFHYIYSGGEHGLWMLAVNFMAQVTGALALFMVPSFASYIFPAGAMDAASEFINGIARSLKGAGTNTVKGVAKGVREEGGKVGESFREPSGTANALGTSGKVATAASSSGRPSGGPQEPGGDGGNGKAAKDGNQGEGAREKTGRTVRGSHEDTTLTIRERCEKAQRELDELEDAIASGRLEETELMAKEQRFRKVSEELDRLEKALEDGDATESYVETGGRPQGQPSAGGRSAARTAEERYKGASDGLDRMMRGMEDGQVPNGDALEERLKRKRKKGEDEGDERNRKQ